MIELDKIRGGKLMKDQVKKYYGESLKSSNDLQTNACCTSEAPASYLIDSLKKIHPEVNKRYYGCGLIAPEQLSGLRILDLGCGAGRDCFVLSALVGEAGRVVGVDMTSQQLEVANRYIDYHREAFGFDAANVQFHEETLENLDALNFQENHFDVIVSNCVINLCTDKSAVLEHAYRLLKPGGEMYFSDVYADRRLSDEIRNDPVLYGECLAGSFYWNDFLTAAKAVGFIDPRLVADNPITIQNEQLARKVGEASFYSATYRLFKLPGLEPACEDYGQAVIYNGSIEHCPAYFELDKHHRIPTGKVFPVCGNTYRMLSETRFSPHFEFIGDGKLHFGIFEGCGTQIPFEKTIPGNQQSTQTCC